MSISPSAHSATGSAAGAYTSSLSPSGGGPSLILNDANAGWDLIWAVPPLAIDRSQTISTRLVYQRPEAPSHDYTDAAWLEEGHF